MLHNYHLFYFNNHFKCLICATVRFGVRASYVLVMVSLMRFHKEMIGFTSKSVTAYDIKVTFSFSYVSIWMLYVAAILVINENSLIKRIEDIWMKIILFSIKINEIRFFHRKQGCAFSTSLKLDQNNVQFHFYE